MTIISTRMMVITIVNRAFCHLSQNSLVASDTLEINNCSTVAGAKEYLTLYSPDKKDQDDKAVILDANGNDTHEDGYSYVWNCIRRMFLVETITDNTEDIAKLNHFTCLSALQGQQTRVMESANYVRNNTGKNLLTLRLLLGYSRHDLAKRIGVAPFELLLVEHEIASTKVLSKVQNALVNTLIALSSSTPRQFSTTSQSSSPV